MVAYLRRVYLGLTAIVAVCAALTGACAAVGDERTVIDNERGGFFMRPHAGRWMDLGADFGLQGYPYYDLSPRAVKGIHGRFQHFEQVPEINYSYFPYELLMEYEADEVAQGRSPLWVTATYEGKPRRVLFEWHVMGGWGKSQAVNIRDDRFINFFIKQYCRGVLMKPYYPNWHVGLDNSSFMYGLYGVLDDDGKYVSDGIVWDDPFSKNATEWMDAAQYAFNRIAEWAPDVRFVINEGSQADESRYEEVFRPISGILLEGILGHEPWAREHFSNMHFPRMAGPDRDKIQIYQFKTAGSKDLESRLRTGYCLYSICRGPNAFFGPLGEESTEVAPELYAEAKNAIGRPIAATQTVHESGKDMEFCLFSRECEGGMVYLNLTGEEKTIALPAGKWFSRSGVPVDSLSLPDYTGDYVLRQSGERAACPTINPRYGEIVTGPISVQLSTQPWTADTTIRYTIDGTDPAESSPIYAGSLTLSESCTVKARAFKAGLLPSFTAAAAYTITQDQPLVSFHLPRDSGSEFLDDYPLVELSHPSAQPISVAYRVAGGTATAGDDFTLGTGLLEFPPHERYRHFVLPITNDQIAESSETVVIELFDPVNAVLGVARSYTYSIMDNDAKRVK